jgi:hypothetical protein
MSHQQQPQTDDNVTVLPVQVDPLLEGGAEPKAPKKPDMTVKEKAMRDCLFDFIRNLPEGVTKEQMFEAMHLRDPVEVQIAFYERYTDKETVTKVRADIKSFLHPPKSTKPKKARAPKKETVLGDQTVEEVVQAALATPSPSVATPTEAPAVEAPKKAPKTKKVATEVLQEVARELFPVPEPVPTESTVPEVTKAPMKTKKPNTKVAVPATV